MATQIKPSGIDSTQQFAFANTVNITAPVSANGTVGTAGQVLTSSGAGANVYWADAAAGGGGSTSSGFDPFMLMGA